MKFPEYVLHAEIIEKLGSGELKPEEFVKDVKETVAKFFGGPEKVAEIPDEEFNKLFEQYPEVVATVNLDNYAKGLEILNQLQSADGKIAENTITPKELSAYVAAEAYAAYSSPEVQAVIKMSEEAAPAPNPQDRPDLQEPAPSAPGPAGNPPQTTPATGAQTPEEAKQQGAQQALTQLSPQQAQQQAMPGAPTADNAAAQAQAAGAQVSTNFDGNVAPPVGGQAAPQAAPQMAPQAAAQVAAAEGAIDDMMDQFAGALAGVISDAQADHAANAVSSGFAIAQAAIQHMASIAAAIVQGGGGPQDILNAANEAIQEIHDAINEASAEAGSQEAEKQAGLGNVLIPAAAGLVGLGAGAYAMHHVDTNRFEQQIPEIANMVGPEEAQKIRQWLEQAFAAGYQQGVQEAQAGKTQ